ncbi:DUF5988 family protein [Kitasatospora sp. GAS204B]|uniref:DUF5988 family protein n=1 Tax=unclassified Kitasatospora TaxID=2633591 RepID=UPI002474EAF6|nr:DUF5988 family protein [Kitasatospora sp. GAS204B]MDH6122869.1 hypothetical protein [Kitasatospora sp. GAS204B]
MHATAEPNAYLAGGRRDFPQANRLIHLDPPDQDKTALTWCGSNEHFVLTEETVEHDGHQIALYRWAYRTSIAE